MKQLTNYFHRLNNWHILFILVALTVLTSFISGVLHGDFSDTEWWSNLSLNFSTELMGAIATFLIFELIFNIRNEKKSLIVDLRSGDDSIYRHALKQIKANNWLVDGSLAKANLANADLRGMNLQNINLKDAYLRNVNFEGSDLRFAELENADLNDANLKGADLSSSDLENANLQNADLRGAKLGAANLKRAKLQNAKFDETTTWIVLVGRNEIPAILPDGELWQKRGDIDRFVHAPKTE